MSAPATHSTHERFIQSARDAVIAHAEAAGTITTEQAERARHAKLLYGIGDGSYRGICHYDAWENGVGKVDVIEIAASAQESFVQLAGTTLHELAHVLAGWGTGHGPAWKEMAVALGFTVKPEAAGQVYRLAMFAPGLRHRVYALAAEIGDGLPAFTRTGWGVTHVIPKPCSAGIGTKGGTSRGKGSGSRMRLWECKCPRPVKVRVASDDFQAHCDVCDYAFTRS
jgi:hypothetical protein